ncbi:hypothetical protein [Azospirillum sp. TSO5]|uniref:hypothetical protein n=1 Tax=Azospirillum sp. TSO5 TaxID=716760 RepID=UPI000D6060B1|nr:hypothetical protein [Azospirillum sp. TSO5]PWC98070.1 hypothetical protein TSO5_03460 [Azospirillum sp. TSO5]
MNVKLNTRTRQDSGAEVSIEEALEAIFEHESPADVARILGRLIDTLYEVGVMSSEQVIAVIGNGYRAS